MIGVDLSGITRNLIEDIVACEAIEKISSNMKLVHVKFNHMLSLDAMRRMKKRKLMTKTSTDEKMTQYKEEEQPSEPEIEVGSTNKMIRESL